MRLLDIVVWAMPFQVLLLVTNPFVVRFARVQVMPVVNGLGLVGHLAPVFVLVPGFGARGAAWSLVIGHAVQSPVNDPRASLRRLSQVRRAR